MTNATFDTLAVVGLGYVGLPLTVALGKHFDVVGFDTDEHKINSYIKFIDPYGNVDSEDMLESLAVDYTADPAQLSKATMVFVTVPTPVDEHNLPDLRCLERACRTIGQNMQNGTIVVIESTVAPGTTVGKCIPWLEKSSGFVEGRDFFIAYSPERVAPGDNVLSSVAKIVGSTTPEVAQAVADVYSTIITAPVCVVSSIEVAELSKMLENVQRDVNIALMNEFNEYSNKIGVNFSDVLAAASTKWNFVSYQPGLVGGHCIGVDPLYVIDHAAQNGCDLSLTKTARDINERCVTTALHRIETAIADRGKDCKVTFIGVTYKPNCSDVRNSKPLYLLEQLRSNGYNVTVCDHHITPIHPLFGTINPVKFVDLEPADVVIVAVKHKSMEQALSILSEKILPNGVIINAVDFN